jgi:hypothetical protein
VAFDKTIEAKIFGVTNQNSSVRLAVGDSSGGTFTAKANPLRGSLVWDDCQFVIQGLSVAGGATGGSYTLTIETDAVSGYTGLPIARTLLVGPLTKGTVVMQNLHNSPGAPLPTRLNITQVATGGGIWLQCHVLAKQYRGTLGTKGVKTSERVVQGVLTRGDSQAKYFATTDDTGVSDDTTFTLGTSGNDLGMNRIRLWDRAFYWAVSNGTVAGTWDFDIVGKVGGNTFTIATTGTTGNLAAAGDKFALFSKMGGISPNPTQVIWTEVSAGGVSRCTVVGMAKTGRGSMIKG